MSLAWVSSAEAGPAPLGGCEPSEKALRAQGSSSGPVGAREVHWVGQGVQGGHPLFSDLTPGKRHAERTLLAAAQCAGDPGAGFPSVQAPLPLCPPPPPPVWEWGRKERGVRGGWVPSAPRPRQSPGRCLLKEAALLGSGPRAAGSGGPHGAACDRDPWGWEKAGWAHLGSPCVLAGTVASLRDGPRGQGAAERAKGRRLGVRVGLSWPAGPWLGGAGAVIAGAGPPAPVPALFNSCCFQHGFSLSSPAIKPREGPGVGNRTQDAGLQGDCPSTDTQSGCSPARPRLCSGQLSPPMDAG